MIPFSLKQLNVSSTNQHIWRDHARKPSMENILKERMNLQQQDSHAYTADWHVDYSMGPGVHGGAFAAIIQATALLHLSTTLASTRQPDVHTVHIEFLRHGSHHPFTIEVTDTKTGRGTNFLQIRVLQDNILKVIAMVTSTNFSVAFGPSCPTAVTLHPPPPPRPDFSKIESFQPEPNWLPGYQQGELLPVAERITGLYPRVGFLTPGVLDIYASFKAPETITSTHLALLCDFQPSMSDTLQRNKGVFDAHAVHDVFAAGAKSNPGKPAVITPTLEDAGKSVIWNSTLTLDIEFKRRIEDLRWIHTRTEVNRLQDGRMDLNLTIFDGDGELVCLGKQVMLVLDARRRWGKGVAKQQKL